MPKGIWLWPSDPKLQRRALRQVSESPHLMTGLSAVAKSKDGLSNAEMAEALNDTAEWTTLWVIRQLSALGFIEFKVDFFGNPARYQATDRGREALAAITGKPLPKPAVPTPSAPQPAKAPPAPTPAPPQPATKAP